MIVRARLRDVVAEADLHRLHDRAEFLVDPVAQIRGDLRGLFAFWTRASARHQRRNHVAARFRLRKHPAKSP